jgi:hypothetical protein
LTITDPCQGPAASVFRFDVAWADALIAFGDPVVVDAGIATSHQSAVVELPVFVAVALPPLSGVVAPQHELLLSKRFLRAGLVKCETAPGALSRDVYENLCGWLP